MSDEHSAPPSPPDGPPTEVPAPLPYSPNLPGRTERRSRAGWFVLAAVLVMGLGLLGTCVTCLQSASFEHDETIGKGGKRVGVVELSGAIVEPSEPLFQLRRFRDRRDIDAIVLRIDSPGGAVAPSQELFSALRATSAEKPVVASLGTVAASGGFWVAMGADFIFASPGSITGSIGVISQAPDLQRLVEWMKVRVRTYKSGPLKDLQSPLRDATAEDEAVIMDLIMDVYEQFVSTIATRRKLDIEVVKKLADGRIFTGQRALDAGLIDALGGLAEAAKKAAELAESRLATEENRAPKPVDDPTLIYPRDPMPAFLRLLAEESGESFGRGLMHSILDGVETAQTRMRPLETIVEAK